MPAKSRFTRLDAFTKTVEDARIRTTSGGIVTLASLLLILYLSWSEWADYRRIIIHPELIVDKARGEKMEIHLNVSFPRVPCELLTLDVMDVSGDVQTGVMHGVNKVRLRAEGEGGGAIDSTSMQLGGHEEGGAHLDPAYCGECYGAPAPANVKKPGCCNTCAEVREAYASVSWSFGRGENVEQCEREHYSEHLDEQRREGCRIEGGIRVNKVVGNFHFAPGKSFSNGNMHVHDLETYFNPGQAGVEHTFTHNIHHLRFGPELPADIVSRVGKKGLEWSNHHLNPLDGTDQKTDEKAYNYMYFVKVVSTAYLPLGWDRSHNSKLYDVAEELIGLGEYGYHDSGSIETHQYSVTSHKRSLAGGDGADQGHKERLHARGGIPGVFFSYVSSSRSRQITPTPASCPVAFANPTLESRTSLQ